MGNGQILATYGRIGASSNEMFGERTYTYPKRMYWIKVLEKLNKGYKDMTDIYLSNNTEQESSEKNTEPIIETETPSSQLYKLLKSYSRHVVKTSCVSSSVTEKMVEEAHSILNNLYKETSDVERFNKLLVELLSVAPRRVDKVQKLLAVSVNDFERIIAREENLLMAMEALVSSPCKKEKTTSVDGFESQNIEVYFATDKQRAEVIEHLSDQLKSKVKNVYRVIHPEHKKRFNQYLEENHIKNVKQLWHGSKNENWLSIISHGLLLKPNAVITGKMLGDGIYFAPSSMKSWGYTSYHNTYWARGSSDVAFMGLYACAYGTPKDVTSPGTYTQAVLDASKCNCIHAHAGSYLRNDEIVFYTESAMLLNYIVEFN